MVTYLKIIALKDFGKYYIDKIKNIEVLYPNISLEKCETSKYWKEPQLVEIEVEFSVSSPIYKVVWEKILSQIADNYVVTYDADFTTFEHFDNVETLKKGNYSCFVVLNVPNNLIDHRE